MYIDVWNSLRNATDRISIYKEFIVFLFNYYKPPNIVDYILKDVVFDNYSLYSKISDKEKENLYKLVVELNSQISDYTLSELKLYKQVDYYINQIFLYYNRDF